MTNRVEALARNGRLASVGSRNSGIEVGCRTGGNCDRALDEAGGETAAFVWSSLPVPEIPRCAPGCRAPGSDS